ncbi:hypothetical protein MTR67_026329 [Solanum verrucosum]|uniref:Integrase catalytic domain-containing protein n=1 Tax=Solanum verrucosum TaxID=315347 RepID=A0AAF0R7I6_SOLVR|nr:hypothetical protein MTR67_026329 [Solanum verrucosum]
MVRLHGLPLFIIADRGTQFTSQFWKSLQKSLGTRAKLITTFHSQTDGKLDGTIQTLEDMLRACVIDFKGNWDDNLPLIEFAYNNSYHSSISMAPFKALYCKRYISPIGSFEVGEVALLGPQLLHEAMKKLKISPMKGVMRFGKKGKLSPHYVVPYHILRQIVFHVSMLKKCVCDLTSIVPFENLGIKESISYEEVPVEILDLQVKKLRNKEVVSIKVLWRNQRVMGATWEAEDDMMSC